MDNQYNKKITKEVDDLIVNAKYQTTQYLKTLRDLQSHVKDEEKLAVIGELMTRLEDFRKLTPADLGLVKDGEEYHVSENFNNHEFYGYDIREQRYNRLDKESKEAKREGKIAKLSRLQNKKGRIINKQLRVTRKILKQRFYDYQKNKELFLDSVAKEISALKRRSYSTVFSSAVKASMAEYKKDIKIQRAENRGEEHKVDVIEARGNNKTQKVIDRLNNKLGIIKEQLNSRIATNVSEERKNKLRAAARKIGNFVSHIVYWPQSRYEENHKGL